MERQIGVLYSTAAQIFNTAKANANYNDFHKILACYMPPTNINLSYNLRLPLIIDGTLDLAKVYNAIMGNPHLLFYKAALIMGI